MPKQDRIEEIMLELFSLLNEKKVSPEEGFLIAEEILMTSMERYAKQNNVSPDEVHSKLLDHLIGEKQKSHQRSVYVVGQNRGWIGNPKSQTENN